jgi:hypothetical protein
MFCPRCGADRGDARFCSSCGVALEAYVNKPPTVQRRRFSTIVPVICAVAFAVPLFLIIGYLGPTRPSDKPFQKETAQQREELNSCFDKGDEIGDTYHVIEGSKSAGTFTEDNFEHGFARERYRDSECGKLQGVKCQRACKVWL